ncbi:hypothetical protein STIUS_v1c04050 [Spiroplasma sp. TIUS-1]|uniref:hypothetical protein n=1 Tax=Spiroplasma sp. TIUS-1 TaxID=216963 RepID=UPI00139811D0|nr:hypothetical protein [Spiroplasma sp. TIUS-1]QHX35959.1 hypothetical protein STIUS_v1c04050 [Spiroplasma sp. TIUS-1]
MSQDQFLDKWGSDFNVENTEKSFKLVRKETGKAVIWVTSKNHNVGMAGLPNIEIVADFIDLCREVIKPW